MSPTGHAGADYRDAEAASKILAVDRESHPDDRLWANRTRCLSVDRASACLRRYLTAVMLRRGRQLQHRGGLAGS